MQATLDKLMAYITPNLENSALITIDVQNDFTLDGAPVQIPGTLEVIPNIVRLLKTFRQLAFPIIHIVRIYLPNGSNADLCRKALLEKGASIVLPDSRGVEIVDDLKPTEQISLDARLLLQGRIQKIAHNEAVIFKPRWGAFYKTPLHDYLRELKIDTLLFCGCNFPNCPRTSVYEASERDFKIVLATDAVSGLYDKACQEMQNIGVSLWKTVDIIDKL